MTKKIGLFVISAVVFLGFGVIFADIIPDNSHYVDKCVKLQNVEIDNYRVIVENDTVMDWEVYEPKAEKCLRGHYHFGESRQYLLDKSIDIEEITKDNIQDKAIKIGNLSVNGRYVDNSNPLTSQIFIYKIVKYENNYELEMLSESIEEDDSVDNDVIEKSGNYLLESDAEEQNTENTEMNEDIENENNYKLELVETEQGVELNSNRFVKFGIAWILTILIETIALFVIAKIFRKNDQISNWKLLLFGILASTITLPLLRFVLPLFITDEVCYIVVGELLVTFIEVFIIKYGLKISWGKAILASIICNLCSYLLGVMIF